MAELKDLIKNRANIRGRLTKFNTYLSTLLEREIEQVSKQEVNELKLRLAKLQHLFSEFDVLQSKIESLHEDEASLQIDERELTEGQFFSSIAQSQQFLLACEEYNNKKEQVSKSKQSSLECSNIKLPTIRLNPFDGSPNKWLEFRDTFQSLVHNNNAIDEISKFHYLKSCLEGSASAVINSINVSSDNYNVAWNLLCERFDNKRLLINHHLQCLFAIEPLPRESEKGLRSLIDTITKNLRSLNLLGEPTHYWDTMIVFMVSSKLDISTARKWEEYKSNFKTSPKLEEFFTFLRNQSDVLEALNSKKSIPDINEKRVNVSKFKTFMVSSPDTQIQYPCLACRQDHRLYDCPQFKTMSVDERMANVSQWNLCSNCLRTGHRSFYCRLGGCRICYKKHNTLLHRQQQHVQQADESQARPHNLNVSQAQQHLPATSSLPTSSLSLPMTSQRLSSTSYHLPSTSDANHLENSAVPFQSTSFQGHASIGSRSAVSSGQVFLSTALVKVTNNDHTFILRALLDSGSQSSFITQAAQQRIGCNASSNEIKCVSGLNNASFQINKHCNLNLSSLHNTSFETKVKCFVVPTITDRLPNMKLQTEFHIPSCIKLADPGFNNPSEIDLLLGADIFWDIIGSKQEKLGPNRPILRESQLGWVVAGPTGGSLDTSSTVHCNFSQDIRNQLSKFWELEELPTPKFINSEDQICEDFFCKTTYRDIDGRFCVQMPLREPTETLGDSYHMAKTCMFSNLKRLNKKPAIKQSYCEFINEYKSMGHLTEIPKPAIGCYLPHHPVLREQSETTKLRVVFNASAKTSSGKSLNDIQYVGPSIQDDLMSILLRFRQYQYALTADVEKMYRQILIDPSQRHLQLILWQDEENEPIKVLQLNTVTYGTASAPFLSTRCLLQLSKECSDPKIASIIQHDFYMDDLLCGADSKEELRYICHGVTQTLDSACFPLRKYRTNAPSIFDNNLSSNQSKAFDASSSVLGLKWHPSSDCLQFAVQLADVLPATKRSILANSAKIFDPLGLLSACTIIPKILLQRLWSSKLDWDDPIPNDLERKWLDFIENLSHLGTIEIPRCILSENVRSIELHSFSDASQDAYAACIYLRSIDESGEVLTRLLYAKTKVAPLKPTTIPRLELLGALLSIRLTVKVIKSLRCKINRLFHWTDSTIVLGWLETEPRNLKTFVSNRIGEILESSSLESWKHIPGDLNPADLASRGVEPHLLRNASLWWQGPFFLKHDVSCWPERKQSKPELPEIKAYILNDSKTTKNMQLNSNSTLTITDANPVSLVEPTAVNLINPMNGITGSAENKNITLVQFERFSKYSTIQRVYAYVLRFIYNIRHSNNRFMGQLTSNELESSQNLLIKQAQQETFSEDLKQLNQGKNLLSKSRILSLTPFVDENGLLRVGGRLQQSSEQYTKKHPLLLDSKHYLTKLLFVHEHIRLLHCGPQLLLSSIRDRIWPIKSRILARSTVNNCKICRLMKAKTLQPIMGNLPVLRVTPNLPFEVTATDFAGPFYITDRKGRGCKITKAYLCLFVCLSTKALHLEVASDLSSEVFILCLRRFISRRGKPSILYCDNGSNFVGASNEIGRLLEQCKDSVQGNATNEGIRFLFSPAYSPNFNGLAEAGIKSAKFHITRILGNTHMTFEELSTLFSQVEAILNSRPITPLSSDPNDLDPLTPGHFLVGRSLTSLPSPTLLDVKQNRLSRYKVLEQFRQQFWNRWSREYLTELQQRTKWRVKQAELMVGDMVVIKDHTVPPLKWRMGRISKVYPGTDGITRVADVKTQKGTIRRAISNLCPLLPDQNLEIQDVRGGGDCYRIPTATQAGGGEGRGTIGGAGGGASLH